MSPMKYLDFTKPNSQEPSKTSFLTNLDKEKLGFIWTTLNLAIGIINTAAILLIFFQIADLQEEIAGCAHSIDSAFTFLIRDGEFLNDIYHHLKTLYSFTR